MGILDPGSWILDPGSRIPRMSFNISTAFRVCHLSVVTFILAYPVQARKDLLHICLCFCYVCRLTIPHNGGGLRPPPQRWAGGLRPPHRCGNHYGGWRGGQHSKNISKYLSNTCVFAYLAYFLIFPLRRSWSYSISEMHGPAGCAQLAKSVAPYFPGHVLAISLWDDVEVSMMWLAC